MRTPRPPTCLHTCLLQHWPIALPSIPVLAPCRRCRSRVLCWYYRLTTRPLGAISGSRMRKTIMLLLVLASPAVPAAAQVSGYELFAAYCLGVFEQREQEGIDSGLQDAARQQAQTVGR